MWTARRGPAVTCLLAGKLAQGRWRREGGTGKVAQVGCLGGWGRGQSGPGHQAGFPALW